MLKKNVQWGKDVITGEIQVDWLTRPFNKQVEKYFRVKLWILLTKKYLALSYVVENRRLEDQNHGEKTDGLMFGPR